MQKHNYAFETRAIHAGGNKHNAEHALNPPIFMTSSFSFENTEAADAVMSFKSQDYVYTRGNNPTLRLFEERISSLENGSAAVAFASGMAAISSVLFSLLKPGDELLVHRTLYGSSYSFVTTLLEKYGITANIADFTNIPELEKKISAHTKVLFFETPSNPNLEIIDLKRVAELAKSKSLKTIVDNTFASPFFQRPLDFGIDIVVHSATKYLNGHGDVLAGVAISQDYEYIQNLKFSYMCEFGGVLSPFNAWLVLRGMKTLAIRMQQHEENAKAAALFLEGHKKIASVMYPGLRSFPYYNLASRQMSGYGAILGFEVKGGLKEAKKIINKCELFSLAVSLGDCETLIQLPAAMTHKAYSKESLKQFGLSESMIRLSLGLENINDILFELERILS